MASGDSPNWRAHFLRAFSVTLPGVEAASVNDAVAHLRKHGAASSAAPQAASSDDDAASRSIAWEALSSLWSQWSPEVINVIAQLLLAAGDPWEGIANRMMKSCRFELSGDGRSRADALLLAFRETGERAIPRDPPDPNRYQPINVDDVIGALSVGGACQRHISEYEYRKGQTQMASAVADALNDSRHLIVEAGTGVGKSVGYLLPGIMWAVQNKCPLVVSTNTKNLQSQLFDKDIPALRDALPINFKAALIKGRGNYLCLRRLLGLLDRREVELGEDFEKIAAAKALAWATTTQTGDLEEMDRALEGTENFAGRLCSNGDECSGRKCWCYSRCFVQRARIRSLNADVVVANHSLVFAEGGMTAPVSLPRHAHLILDEAHNLEEAATLQYTIELSRSVFGITLRRLLRSRKSKESGLLVNAQEVLNTNLMGFTEEQLKRTQERLTKARIAHGELKRAANTFFVSLKIPMGDSVEAVRFRAGYAEGRNWAKVMPLMDELFRQTDALALALTEFVEPFAPSDSLAKNADSNGNSAPDMFQRQREHTMQDISAAIASLAELAKSLEFVSNADDKNYVFWLEHDNRGARSRFGGLEPAAMMKAAPVDISEKLLNDLFKVKDTVILCSATMSVDGSFSYLANRIGISRCEPGRVIERKAESPFNYSAQCKALAAGFMPNPRLPGFSEAQQAEALSGLLAKVATETKGRMLVLFTSYSLLRKCHDLMAQPLAGLGIQLLAQGGGKSRERLTKEFREDISSVLLGTDSFWEGVDVVGEALSCLVVTKLPFDPPGDPLFQARGEKIDAEGGNSFASYAVPNAVIKFRQGIGRLIRHRKDRGVIIVTDPRIFTLAYGARFRRAMPSGIANCATEESLLSEIRAFFSR